MQSFPSGSLCKNSNGQYYCTDLSNDVTNCGTCGNACTAPNFGHVSCVNGQCIPACVSGESLCENSIGQYCTVLSNDPANCGACGHACTAPTGGTVSCVNGQCVPACPSGYQNCTGSSCSQCPTGPTVCSGGSCVCASGYVNCGGTCTKCPSQAGTGPAFCRGTQCVVCGPGNYNCSGNSCTNILSDNNNCGGCNTGCNVDYGYTCVSGTCTQTSTQCAPGQAACADQCYDRSEQQCCSSGTGDPSQNYLCDPTAYCCGVDPETGIGQCADDPSDCVPDE